MQNNVKVIAVFSALVISVLIFLFVFDDSDKARSKYISSDWDKIGGPLDLEPNGFGIFSNLLLKKHQVSSLKLAKTVDSLKGVASEGSLYLVMGDKVAFLEKEWKQIRSTVEQGSTLFICSNKLSGSLAEDLLENNSLRFSFSESVTTGFYNEQKRSMGYKIYQNDTLAQKWYFTDSQELAEPITFINQTEFVGCARFSLGKGQVILSLNADLLRNYQLNRLEWRPYVNRFLQEIPVSKRIYWLSFGLLGDNENTSGQDEGQGEMEDNSLLKLFFANRILTMALLLITFGVLLFILFRIRRRRPIVTLPLKERHHASEFTRTVTSIFINRRNPYGILQLQRKNFYMLIQRYYYLDISKLDSDRDRSVTLLSEKSGVDKEFIVRILQLLETKVRINVTDNYLFDVYNRIQDFYRKAGIQQYKEHRVLKEFTEIRRGLSLVLLLIGAGLILFVAGLWLLTMAQSFGVLLFIGAFVLLIGGFRMMNLPIISWTEEELFLYSKGFSKRTFFWRDLLSVESDANVVTWRFSNNGFVQLRWSEISRFDHGRLQRLIEIKSKNN